MKNDLLSKTLKTLFIDVGLKGSLSGAINAIKSFFAEHQKEYHDLVHREEETEE